MENQSVRSWTSLLFNVPFPTVWPSPANEYSVARKSANWYLQHMSQLDLGRGHPAGRISMGA